MLMLTTHRESSFARQPDRSPAQTRPRSAPRNSTFAPARSGPRPAARATRPAPRAQRAGHAGRRQVSCKPVVVELRGFSGRRQLTLSAQPVPELIASALFEVDEVRAPGDLTLIGLAPPRARLARTGRLA